MSREQKIELLIMDRIWEWIYARCDEGLWDMLRVGFVGFNNYSNKELDDEVEELDDKVEELKAMLEMEKERQTNVAGGGEPF